MIGQASGAPTAGTTIGPAPAQESHWTPQVIIGGIAFVGVLAVLAYKMIVTTDAAVEGQLIIAMTGIGSAGATYFLGNMQRPRAQPSVTVEPPATVNVTDGNTPPPPVAGPGADPAGNIGAPGR